MKIRWETEMVELYLVVLCLVNIQRERGDMAGQLAIYSGLRCARVWYE